MPFELSNPPPKAPKQKPVKREKGLNKEDRRKLNNAMNQVPIASNDELWFRHTSWQTKRMLVRAALAGCGTPERAMEAFDNCGAQCVVEYCEEEKKFRIRGSYCHNRHCEPCNRAKANLLAANLRKRLEEKPDGRYRFITLTLKHNDAPLRTQIDRLYAAFSKMRKTKLWKDSQNGGCIVLEVKWQPGTRRWHPHLHVISEGGFITQRDLSSAWLNATGDSSIVDIRQLSAEKDVAHYVAKYVSKGTNDEVWKDTDAAQEWILAMKGVRTCATFGKWRGFKLLAHVKDEKFWKPIGTLHKIVSDAREGQPYAVGLLGHLLETLQYDPHKQRGKKKPDL